MEKEELREEIIDNLDKLMNTLERYTNAIM